MKRICLALMSGLALAYGLAAEDAVPAAASGTAAVAPDTAGATATAKAPQKKKAKKAKKPKSSQAYKAPNFSLRSVATGKTVTLSDLQGKVVLLDFWATWCPPCRAEIPHFVELKKRYGSKGFEVVGVSVDQGNEQAVLSFMQRQGINYPVVIDNGQVAMNYGGVRSIPTTFLLGPNGEKLGGWLGYNDISVFDAAVRKALSL